MGKVHVIRVEVKQHQNGEGEGDGELSQSPLRQSGPEEMNTERPAWEGESRAGVHLVWRPLPRLRGLQG